MLLYITQHAAVYNSTCCCLWQMVFKIDTIAQRNNPFWKTCFRSNFSPDLKILEKQVAHNW